MRHSYLILFLLLVTGGCGVEEARTRARLMSEKGSTDSTERFVLSVEGLNGEALEHYVDFSLETPRFSWSGYPGESENFYVGGSKRRLKRDSIFLDCFITWYPSSGTLEGDLAIFSRVADSILTVQRGGEILRLKVAEGRTRFGRYDGYHVAIDERPVAATNPSLIRLILLPAGPGYRDGLAVFLERKMARYAEVQAANLGADDGLAILVNSLLIGKDEVERRARSGSAGQ